MRRPTSLALRLTLLFALLATVVFLLFGWFISQSIDQHFIEEDKEELIIIAKAVEQSLQKSVFNESTKQRIDDILIGHHNALLFVEKESGESLYANAGADFLSELPKTFLTASKALPLEITHDQQSYRVYFHHVRAHNQNEYFIKVAVSIDYHLRFLNEFRRTLWLMILSGIAIIVLMAWLVVQQGHKPLRTIVDRMKKINSRELNLRIDPQTVPVELSKLTISFNDMLQRMEEDFIRLSNFSADIAHELRTPVTNLMTQTQVAFSQTRDNQEYQEILYSSMDEYNRMAQMIGDMLFLAKADNRLSPFNAVIVDLAKETDQLFEYYEALAEECSIHLSRKGSATVNADALMMRRALNNLLSNAIRHTTKKGKVVVSLKSEGDSVIISMENTGAKIPPEHLSRIFDRFYRVDPSRQRSGEGAGLGLAIVKSIIDIHDGSITVDSDDLSTQFSIKLPVKNF